MISKEVIKALDPCSDRWENYLKFYGDRSFSHRQFMGLKNITHEDKLWVAFRLLPKEKLCFVAADIAESVLHIYEEKYPNDSRPRKAIEAARNGNANAAANADARAADAAAAAYAAAYAAYAADAAAHAAAYAAADAARAATHAATHAADAAAHAADAAAHDKPKQQKLIRTIILKYWK